MTYSPKLAAALSGATLRQLARWRRADAGHAVVLVPELSRVRPLLYSFRDVVAARTAIMLGNDASLRKIRSALDALREDRSVGEYLSARVLVAENDTIRLADRDQAADTMRGNGNLVICDLADVIAPFYRDGRQIPDLLQPRAHISVIPGVRGGVPVIDGRRIAYDEVALQVRGGVPPEDLSDIYEGVSADAARDAAEFADYVDSYGPQRVAA